LLVLEGLPEALQLQNQSSTLRPDAAIIPEVGPAI
jgi:hypothetical protein